MAVIKNKKTGMWEVRTYYKDWTGERKQKTKRGFAKKSEALEWERNFKLKENQSISMSFQSFVDIYLTDLEPRIKRNTFLTKKHIIETKILPYFGKMKLDDIRTSDVIQWQNEIMKLKKDNGKLFSQTYLKTIHNQLSAILNYAVNMYREMLDPTIRWTDRLQSSSGEWSGNICDFYFRVYNKIIKDIKVPFKTSGGDRIDDTPVHEALREALANCLINTDYYGVRGVVIKKEPDKLILENPGYIRTGKEQMRKGGESDPRNKALMKMFNLINIGERAGSGVPNIFNVWEDEGWIEPVIEEKFDPDRTILTLEFKKKSGDKKATKKSDDKKATKKSDGKKVTKKTQAQYDKILDFMEFDKEYSLQEFCELLDLKETRTKAILKQLNEYIEPIGSTKNRKYLRKK